MVRKHHQFNVHKFKSKLQDIVKDREARHAAVQGSQRVRCYLETEQQQIINRLASIYLQIIWLFS